MAAPIFTWRIRWVFIIKFTFQKHLKKTKKKTISGPAYLQIKQSNQAISTSKRAAVPNSDCNCDIAFIQLNKPLKNNVTLGNLYFTYIISSYSYLVFFFQRKYFHTKPNTCVYLLIESVLWTNRVDDSMIHL